MLPVIKASAGFSARVSRCMVRGVWPPFDTYLLTSDLNLDEPTLCWDLFIELTMKVLGDEDDFCPLFCCAAETSKMEKVDRAAHSRMVKLGLSTNDDDEAWVHSSYDQARTEHR